MVNTRGVVSIEELAHRLGISRWANGPNGQNYSVAEHAINVSRIVREDHGEIFALVALFHCACFMIRADDQPALALPVEYDEAQRDELMTQYHLDPEIPDAVIGAERDMIEAEQHFLMGTGALPDRFHGVDVPAMFRFMEPNDAAAKLVERIGKLHRSVRASRRFNRKYPNPQF